uniref:Uncharacterized protein n=1 Tax=Hyaloperonospora arabidopsidis (strain Emoy2) TaxID=559515 RepID=M4C6K3_HYAAE
MISYIPQDIPFNQVDPEWQTFLSSFYTSIGCCCPLRVVFKTRLLRTVQTTHMKAYRLLEGGLILPCLFIPGGRLTCFCGLSSERPFVRWDKSMPA